MTVRELLARIDSRELSEWLAFFSMEPWGTETEDLRAGVIASTIANVNRDKKKQAKPYKPADFVPKREQPIQKEQSWEEQVRIMEKWGQTWETKFGK